MKLREIQRIRQRPQEPRRRWFTAHNLDIFVWQTTEERLVGFQITYGNPAYEKAISWRKGEVLRHSNVMVGGPTSGGYPGSPLLTSAEENDVWSVCGELLRRSGALEKELLHGICRMLTSTQGNL